MRIFKVRINKREFLQNREAHISASRNSGEKMIKQTANIITISRIVLSLAMLIAAPFSPLFYFLIIFCGISDMLDGHIARKTMTTSETGQRLDSLADLTFAAVCMKIYLPFIQLEFWMWIWIFIIVILKLTNIIWGFVYQRKLVFLHTTANKLTGMAVFLGLLLFEIIPLKWSVLPICIAATFSAIQEGHYIRTSK